MRAAQPPLWRSAEITEELRLGALEGSPHETFGSLIGAAIGPNGEIVVADQQGPVLRLFDPSGRYIRDIGRAGQGPGEFRSIAGVRFTPDGRVAVWDPGNQRISIYFLDGSPDMTIRVNSSLQGGETPFQVDTAGNFYVQATGSREGSVITRFVWIKTDQAGNVLDSLPIPQANPVGRPLVVMTQGGRRRPFTVETRAALSPYGYQVAGRTDRYAVWRPLRDGRVLRIELSAQAVRVGADERQQWEAVLRFMESASRPGAESFRPLPSTKPVFRELWVDDSGRIWVLRYVEAVHVPMSPEERRRREGRPAIEWLEPPVWDVLDERGAFVGTVSLPMHAIPVAAKDATVWLIERGTFGEGYLVRYRVAGHFR